MSRHGGERPDQSLQTFSAAGVVYLRTPVLPRHRADVLSEPPSAADAPPEDERAELTRILRTAAATPLVREALDVSSDALATTLRRLESGAEVGVKQLRRGAYAACRYLLRMTGRPTPFGLMAGVAVGHVAADGEARARLGTGHAKGVRPDGEWLASLVNRLAARAEVLRCLRVCANDLCFERAGRFVLSYVPQHEATDRRSEETSVRATRPVRTALALARVPVPFTDLVEHLAAAHPQAGAERVERLLAGLVASGLLCTELSPPQHCTDPLAHVLAVLERTPAPETEQLRTVAELLDSYARAPLGSGREQWAAATGAMRGLHPARTSPVQVDLRVDAQLALPRTVAREAEAAASVLLRLSPPGGSAPHLADYYWRFLDRYGPGNAVPVKDVLDPERGLGPPAGYRLPANSRFAEPRQERGQAPGQDGLRHRLLGELAQQALLSGSREVVLDEETVRALEPEGPPAPPPPTCEVNFELLAESLAAAERGDFRLVYAPARGMAAGATFGRFCYLFADGAELASVLPPARADVLRAQIAFDPVGGRLSNVMRVPTAVERTLSIGIFDERERADVLGLDDVAVAAGARGLYLVSLPDECRLTALSPQMLDPVGRTPNAARLLREIAAEGTRELWPWRWGDAECLPYLPRVRHGRTVLARARWRPPREPDGAGGAAEWDAALEKWRERLGVPDAVQLRDGDRGVELDLNVPLHRRLFRDELRRTPGLLVTETGRDGEAGLGWLDGHANEIVVPLFSRTAGGVDTGNPGAGPAGSGPAPGAGSGGGEHGRGAEWAPATRRRSVPPGGEWVFAKLYSAPERHREILGDHLPRLLRAAPPAVDRWFFLRYADPDPHLRLRLHGDPEVLNAALLPQLHSWARELNDGGLLRKLELSTYEPETDRYGGPEVIDAAERAFRADSEAVLAQLPLLAPGSDAEADERRLPGEVLAAANFVDLLRRADPGWLGWYEGVPIAHYAGMHRHVRQAVRLVDELPAADGESGGEPDGPARILRTACAHRGPAVADYVAALRGADRHTPARFRAALESLLHMHHNRLLGIDQEREQRVHAVAARLVAAYRGRAREGRA